MVDQAAGKQPATTEDINALFAAFESRTEEYRKKFDALEAKSNESFWARMSGRATAAALFLGLILTGVSIFNAVVTEPEKSRVDRIAQFNDAVNAAAKTSEDLQLFQYQTSSPGARFTMTSYSLTQFSIDIATAETLLRDIDPADVGVQQLLVLMDGAFTVGDLAQAKMFLGIARSKQDVTPYEAAQIDRYAGKYDFVVGDISGARESYLSALRRPIGLPNTAMFLGELTYGEISLNDCADTMTDVESFVRVINDPQLAPTAREEMLAKEREVLQDNASTCPLGQYSALLPAS